MTNGGICKGILGEYVYRPRCLCKCSAARWAFYLDILRPTIFDGRALSGSNQLDRLAGLIRCPHLFDSSK
jgi:hypothetical protein